ncbi:MAG: ArnT family glycosyltransferase, partial [Candidatus Hydrothermia bacterium]
LSGWIYYGILALFLKVFGVNIFWARFVSLVSGAVVLICTYLLGREFRNPWAGLWAATFTSFEILFLRAAHYARTDAMLAATTSVAVLLFVIAVSRKKAWLFISVGLISGISLLVRPLAVFLLPGLALVLMFSKQWRGLGWFAAGAALAGLIIFFTNYLPFARQPILLDIDKANQNSPLFLIVTGRPHLIPLAMERNGAALLAMFLGPASLLGRFAVVKIAAVGAIIGAVFHCRKHPLLYGLILALLAGALLTWPFVRGGYVALFVPLLALGFLIPFYEIRWARFLFVAASLVIGLVAAFKTARECRINRPLNRLQASVLQTVPAGKRVVVNWFWFWWPLRERNPIVAMVDEDFTWGGLSLSDLTKRYEPDYMIVVFWKDFLMWPRQMNVGDTLFLSGLPQVERFYFRGNNDWRDYDSLIIYRIDKGEMGLEGGKGHQ